MVSDPGSQYEPVGWWESTKARLALSWWLLCPLLILLGLVLVLAVTYLGYVYWTRSETFGREIVVAILGSTVTIATSFVVALVAFREQLHHNKEAHALRRFDESSWRMSSLRVGAMRIPHIVVIASCRHQHDWTERVTMNWEPMTTEPRSGDDLVDDAVATRIPAIQAKAARDSVVLTNDTCVDLRHARIDLQRVDGHRRPVYTLTPKVEQYFRFLATTARLDEPYPDPDGDPSTSRTPIPTATPRRV